MGDQLANHLRTLDFMMTREDNMQSENYDLFIALRFLRTIARSLLKTPLRSNAHELQQLKPVLMRLNDSLVHHVYADIRTYIESKAYKLAKTRANKLVDKHRQRQGKQCNPTAVDEIRRNKALVAQYKQKPLPAFAKNTPERLGYDMCFESLKLADDVISSEIERKQQLQQTLTPHRLIGTSLTINIDYCTVTLNEYVLRVREQVAAPSSDIVFDHNLDVVSMRAWRVDGSSGSGVGNQITELRLKSVSALDGSRLHDVIQADLVNEAGVIITLKVPDEITRCVIECN